jgi:two-component sensor histidine kinase
MRGQSAQFNLDGNGVALLLAELDHRIRNLLTTIEAAVKQTHSTTVEDYRAKLIARITGLYSFCEFTSRYSHGPSASSGRVRPVPGAPRKLAIVWVEHGGPKVKHGRRAGFGSRLVKTVLDTAECGWTSITRVSVASWWLIWIALTRG